MNSMFFTPEGLAELYQVRKEMIWKLIREKKIKGVIKVGRRYRIPEEARKEFEELNKA